MPSSINPGATLVLTGVTHILVGLTHPRLGPPLLSMVRSGLFDSITGISLDPTSSGAPQYDRMAAWWFELAGAAMILLGISIRENINVAGYVPRGVAWGTLGVGVIGALVQPLSGCWTLIAQGIWMVGWFGKTKME
ncbi:uncharacterized protein EV422DRAFT_16842 [Fimicolochytrium jonesii]|uniref:uncharacterized protein n=1 Tax=Fimicolochytrium jonesii TaxID=1396493 RepID=UPI0022FEBB06|nr:uncharacterized protein EV422DRAFT_16842 [Fimicolochytrium jonesii]KAI8826908.1 hypothetical protein EV422DRAFT_16842 [Fimicolochytrium jonesii]